MSGNARPAISVALGTYNGEAYVGEQLSSILDQDIPAFEIVVSDDGSTDETLTIVTSISKRYQGPTEIRVVDTERVGGVTPNFDRAIGACRGDVIVLSDQDDVWHRDRLSSLLPHFPGDGAARLVFSDARLIGPDGSPLGGSVRDGLRLSHGEKRLIHSGRTFEALIRRNVVTGAVTALSRELYDLATPFPHSWVHDEWLAILAAALGEVVMLDSTLVDYRLHRDNQIGVADPSTPSRLRRMLAPRENHYVRLAERARDLVDRLDRLPVQESALALALRKLLFEDTRASYPTARFRRVGPVLREFARGSYSRLSSQRRLDIVRDLLQPA